MECSPGLPKAGSKDIEDNPEKPELTNYCFCVFAQSLDKASLIFYAVDSLPILRRIHYGSENNTPKTGALTC